MTAGPMVATIVAVVGGASILAVAARWFRPSDDLARTVSLTAKAGAVAFILGLRDQDAINLQLLGGVWILQIFPAVAIGLYTARLRPRALLAGWAAGMLLGTVLVVRHGFSAVVPLGFQDNSPAIYAGFGALLLNLAVTVVCTAVAGFSERRTGSASSSSPPGSE